MTNEVIARVRKEADYIVVYHTTIEETAKKFNVSVSTVHDDLNEKLPKIDENLYKRVRTVIDYNIRERSIRGGNANKERFEKNAKSKKASKVSQKKSSKTPKDKK